MKRREALLGGLGLAMAGSLPARAADDYPNRPIRVIVPYGPGGGSSLSALLATDALGSLLGQRIVVENCPGATGIVGAAYAIKQPPDGYTLLWATTDLTTVAATKPTLPYKLPNDFSFLGRVAENGLILTTSAQMPVNTMAEFITYVRGNPGKILWATQGVGSTPHLAGLLLEKYTGMKMTAVPYNAIAEGINDMIGGRIQVGLLTPISVAGFIGSGKLRFLGIMSPVRHPLFPDVKTMEELGLPQVKALVWYGLFGPPGIPTPVKQKLEAAIAAIAKDPEVEKKFAHGGLQMIPVLGDAFEKSTVEEYRQWKEIADSNHVVMSD